MKFFRRFCLSLWLAVSLAGAKQELQLLEQVQAFFNGLTSMEAPFAQLSNGKVTSGTFLLKREKGRVLIKFDYEDGQFILVDNEKLIVYHKKTKKKYQYCISHTVIFEVLSGRLDFTKTQAQITEVTPKLVKVALKSPNTTGGQCVNLVFSRYQTTGNIQTLLAFTTEDAKTQTLVSFEPDKTTLNKPINTNEFALPHQ
ncbi:MAG: hypothetical protein LBI20_03760 [Holosporales bacterium]|nr:hypothetical protein [Holosporales bacterium]